MFFLFWKYFCAVSLSHQVKSVRSKWTTLTMGSVLILIMVSLSGCAVGKDTGPIDSPPTASFTHSPASPVAGQAMQFTDTSTGSPTSWQWNFNDGASSTVQNPSHTYSTSGSYAVTLTVTNSSGSTSVTQVINVVPSSTLSASFSCSPASPVVGRAVQFTDTSTGSPTSWQWNFGDGTSSTSRNPSHTYTTTGTKTVTLTVTNGLGSSSANRAITVIASTAIIIDHTSTRLASIPAEWIIAAKNNLHIAYGTASHGSQLYYGATKLVTWAYGGSMYAFNNGGSGGALDWRIWIGNFANLNMATSLDLDQNQSYNNTAWEAATRAYLATNPGVNVIMWAWCYGADTTEARINLYLSLMSGLEADFPNIKFVYMTGHSNGTGESGNLHIRNQQIRNYCIANNKILYDFYDIECWDPNGNYYGNRNISADLSYTGGNWGSEYAAANPQPSSKWFDCSECYGAHSHPLNCNVKIFAAWHLFARLAGWDGN